MKRGQLLILAIGGAVVIALFYLFRNQGALGAANPTLASRNPFSLIPGLGPNTPINTSGTAPYYPGGAYGAGSPRVGTVGPSSTGSIAAEFAGLASVVASIFKSPTPSSQQGGSGPGTVGSYPGGARQQPLDLLNAPPQIITVAPIGPASNAVYGPVSPASLTTFDAPPDVASPSLTPTIDLSALAVAPPSPIGAPTDFSAAMDTAITNPSYYTVPPLTADYASPSYVYDGGEVTTSTG